MGQYLILIYNNEAALNGASPNEVARIQRAHGSFAKFSGSRLRGGARLAGSDAATTIRSADDGTLSISDGIFPESKEVLGGYYVVEAADLDEAIAMAKLVPSTGGGIEVRPIIPS